MGYFRRGEGGTLGLAGGFAAALAAAILLVGVPGLAFAWVVLRPWLAVLSGINAGAGAVTMDSLSVVNPIDIVLLCAAGVAYVGLWPGPGKPHRGWMSLAILLPFAGIAVLLATGLWGRSGLMGGGLVLSLVMLGAPAFRPLGYVGVATNLLLLVGDFSTVGTPIVWVAAVVTAGYALLVGWFAWIAVRLLRSKRPTVPLAHAGDAPGTPQGEGPSAAR